MTLKVKKTQGFTFSRKVCVCMCVGEEVILTPHCSLSSAFLGLNLLEKFWFIGSFLTCAIKVLVTVLPCEIIYFSFEVRLAFLLLLIFYLKKNKPLRMPFFVIYNIFSLSLKEA